MYSNLYLAETPTGSGFSMIFMLLAFVAIFYFMIYRPQKKQEKETSNMRDNLKIGDEISTNGGILGRIVKIKDDIVTIETGSDRNKLKIFKWAVRSVEIPADAENDDE
jgi:preprotein translocase subunit YajC